MLFKRANKKFTEAKYLAPYHTTNNVKELDTFRLIHRLKDEESKEEITRTFGNLKGNNSMPEGIRITEQDLGENDHGIAVIS